MNPALVLTWFLGTVLMGLYLFRVLQAANVVVTGSDDDEVQEHKVRVVMAGVTVMLVILWPLTAVLLLAIRAVRRPS